MFGGYWKNHHHRQAKPTVESDYSNYSYYLLKKYLYGV